MKRLVLLVEGEGEADAVPKLIKRLLTESSAWAGIILDDNPLRVGSVSKLVKGDFREWKRKVAVGLKRRNVTAVLLILDGDAKKVGGKKFCAAEMAKSLANAAKECGAGATYSVAVVFACQEFESWLIAGFEPLVGQTLNDGRLIDPRAKLPEGDLEETPRDAKGWLNDVMHGGYKPTRDQAILTELISLEAIRLRKIRSFRRLENALTGLVGALQTGQHIVSPA